MVVLTGSLTLRWSDRSCPLGRAGEKVSRPGGRDAPGSSSTSLAGFDQVANEVTAIRPDSIWSWPTEEEAGMQAAAWIPSMGARPAVRMN